MRNWKSWRFAGRWRIRLIGLFLSATLLGLFVTQFGVSIKPIMLLAGLFILLFLQRPIGLVMLVLFLGFGWGVFRGQILYRQLRAYRPLYNQPLIVGGKVLNDPSYDEPRHQTEFQLGNIKVISQSLPGQIEVNTPHKLQLRRGDDVEVAGKLKPSQVISRQGSMRFAQVRTVHANTSLLENFRQRFFTITKHSLSEPQASLGLGYLIGLRVGLPKYINDQLALTGLTHIVAVSGYNLTIIVQAVRRKLAHHSAYQSVALTSMLAVGFVAIAGSSPPINRAAIICGFSLAAWYYGRVFQPVILLLLGAVITALLNPINIWGDPSWYLSFLAFAGILLLAPTVTELLYKQNTPSIISRTFIETLSAQLFTLPYSLYLFGTISLIAPLANVLVLPFVPVVMLLVFITGIVGVIVPSFGILIGALASYLLSLQLWIIKQLSTLPLAQFEVTLPPRLLVLAALLLLVITLGLTHRVNHEQLAESSNNRYDLI